jgi:hypothetical protein
MLFLTRLFGVTGSDAERNFGAEAAYSDEIVDKILLMQADAAAKQRLPLCRGTHAKGLSVRGQFEVFDVTIGRDRRLAARLAKGIFARPGSYPATIRFANSDPHVNSDLKADVRSLSFSVDLTTVISVTGVTRQDFTLQNATTLPLNDSRAFAATMKVLSASTPVKALWSLPFRDKLRVLRTILLAQKQARQPVKPYQTLRYWSTVPFRHGSVDVVKQTATPAPENSSGPLQQHNPDALRNELARHLNEDSLMSSFNIGLQLLDTERMTYWGKRHDASFWTENASVEWNESQAPFHNVARLTLEPRSELSMHDSEAVYFDVTRNATAESMPVGSINRARCPAEVASRRARMRTDGADSADWKMGPANSPPTPKPNLHSVVKPQ